MMSGAFESIEVGETRSFTIDGVTRTHFVKYAGAGGDFNPIHHDQTFAEQAGLPTVFGMGMFTAGVLSRIVAHWFGPQSVRRYKIRFSSRIWPGDQLTCSGRAVRVYEEGGLRHVDLELVATNQKGEELIRAEATCRPWQPE